MLKILKQETKNQTRIIIFIFIIQININFFFAILL